MISPFLKPMLPTLSDSVPTGDNWIYEIKYDGFRCLLYWNPPTIIMTSRNGNHLHEIFPEIPEYLKSLEQRMGNVFPLLLDGELCILDNPYKGNFELIQKRGRLKQEGKIKEAARKMPSSFCAFDLLAFEGKYISSLPFLVRKEKLSHLCSMIGIQGEPDETNRFNFIPCSTDLAKVQRQVQTYDCEGIVSKKNTSSWERGTRTSQWIKVKNVKKGCFILTGYDTENGFFHVGVIREGSLLFIGLFSHGMSSEEKEALVQIIKANQSERTGSLIKIEPSLCVELSFLEIYKEQLRQPRFVRFRFDADWEECTWENLQRSS
jgi:DNA ligase D-like protein (predicted ligase)